jgi:hypothetical protein
MSQKAHQYHCMGRRNTISQMENETGEDVRCKKERRAPATPRLGKDVRIANQRAFLWAGAASSTKGAASITIEASPASPPSLNALFESLGLKST